MSKDMKGLLLGVVTALFCVGSVMAISPTARGEVGEPYEHYETWVYEASDDAVEETCEEETETSEMPLFSVCSAVVEEVGGTVAEVALTTEAETTTEAPTEEEHTVPQYTVDGLYYPLNDYLYNRLCDYGIEWWMPYALCTIRQESRVERYAVSKDGKDYGYFQYRKQYWSDTCAEYGFPGADIFDPYVQTEIYVQQTASRIAKGLSVEECISRHKQSDWGEFDQKYVDDVMQWFETVKEK